MEQYNILIVGKVEGETLDSFIAKIEESEDDWRELGISVAHPFVGLQALPDPLFHLPYVFKLLDDFQGIHLIGDWVESDFADLVRQYAFRHNKDIWTDGKRTLNRIVTSVFQVTKIPFTQYSSPDRNKEYNFARMIFAKQCVEELNLTTRQIGALLGRDHTTILHALSNYTSEYDYNRQFKKMADEVKDLVSRY